MNVPLIARFMGRILAAAVAGDTVKVPDPAAGAFRAALLAKPWPR